MTERVLLRDEHIEVYGAWMLVGEPAFPDEIELRVFRRTERGEKLLVEERTYRRVEPEGRTR